MTLTNHVEVLLEMEKEILGKAELMTGHCVWRNKVWKEYHRIWGLVNHLFEVEKPSLIIKKKITKTVDGFFDPYMRKSCISWPGFEEHEKQKAAKLVLPQLGPDGQVTMLEILDDDEKGDQND